MKQIHFLCLMFIATTSFGNTFENLLQINPSPTPSNKKGSCAITYKLETFRRLGDNITTYCKAKYFSHIYNLPLLYKPFPYSDEFKLHESETLGTPEQINQFSTVIPVDKISDITDNKESGESILFECHFLSEAPSLYVFSRQNTDFEKIIKDMFTPRVPIETLPKPSSVVTVAVHVRKGGGFDRPLGSVQEYEIEKESTSGIYLFKNTKVASCTDMWPIYWPAGPKYIEEVKKLVLKKNSFSDYIWPIKFPPDQYYIDRIKELTQMLPGKSLLVYIFTDDPNPQKIEQRYSKALEDYPRIIFSYRESGNHHAKNVLQDLFAMTQCDCLISANSSFANAAQLLGNHSILIMPIHALIMPDKIFINKVAIFGINRDHKNNERSLFYNEKHHKIK